MSCAAFTFLSVYVDAFDKAPDWVVRWSISAGMFFLLLAAFLTWRETYVQLANERRTVASLTESPNIRITVHGIYAHVADGDELFVILPDASIANQSHGLRMAVTADLWMLREGGMEGWCSPAAGPVTAWEQSQHSYRNRAITLPVNLGPRYAEQGYLAFSHRVLRGVVNQPLTDEHQHWRYRVEFKDLLSDAIIHQEEITVSPYVQRV
jgi:hypothetical protein